MISNIKRLSIIQQIGITLSACSVLIFATLTFVAVKKTETILVDQSQTFLQKEVDLVSKVFSFYHTTVMNNTEKLGKVFFQFFDGDFYLDQFDTMSIGKYSSPVLYHDKEVVNLNFTNVDEFTRLTGGTATIFVRYKDDFLRVATSLTNEKGNRAIGTLLGKQHPAYEKLMANESYDGYAHLFGRDYMARYTPIQDARGNIIAILYVGFDFTDGLNSLKQTLAEMKFGDTGFAFVIDASERKKGQAVHHPYFSDKNILDIRNSSGDSEFNFLFSNQAGIKLSNWSFQNKMYSDAQQLVVYSPLQNWGWVVAATVNINELTHHSSIIRNILIGLSIISLLILLALIYKVLQITLKPIQPVIQQLVDIGNGDLSHQLAQTEKDNNNKNEITILVSAVNEMHAKFRTLVSQISSASENVGSSVEHLTAISASIVNGVHQQDSDTEMLATAITEMAASAAEVSHNAQASADEIKSAHGLVIEGKAVVQDVVNVNNTLASELDSAVNVINKLEGASQNIGTVLDVIKNIAEQTNLLALNAAIEAARAGELGRGFAVVADEVRTLAQRSQESTQEIQTIIEVLQSHASEAVQALESGREKGAESVVIAGNAGTALDNIYQNMNKINDAGEHIAVAARAQSEVAEGIHEHIISIKTIASTTAEGASASSNEILQLRQMSDELKSEVDSFKL